MSCDKHETDKYYGVHCIHIISQRI